MSSPLSRQHYHSNNQSISYTHSSNTGQDKLQYIPNLEQVYSALACIASSREPESIQRAQEALLAWEGQFPDEYVRCLLSLIGFVSSDAAAAASAVESCAEADAKTKAATIRLSAVLALKSGVVRRWKDRGRGSTVGSSSSGRSNNPNNRLREETKWLVRQAVLGLLLCGRVGQLPCPPLQSCLPQNLPQDYGGDAQLVPQLAHVISLDRPLAGAQWDLLQDQTLQTNAAALLSKIARMDLPLKFHELIPALVSAVEYAHGLLRQLKQSQQQYNQQCTQQQQHIANQLLTIQQNSMEALECTLAELTSKRLLVDKKYLASVATQHLGRIVECGFGPALADLSFALSSGNQNQQLQIERQPQMQVDFKLQYSTTSSRVVSHLLVSSLHKLLPDNTIRHASTNTKDAVDGLTSLGKETQLIVDHSLTLVHSYLSQWLPLILGWSATRNSNSNDSDGVNSDEVKTHMEELVLILCEMIVNAQQSHPKPFAHYLGPFLELFYSSLMNVINAGASRDSTPAFASPSPLMKSRCKRLLITFLSFLGNVVGASQYHHPSNNSFSSNGMISNNDSFTTTLSSFDRSSSQTNNIDPCTVVWEFFNPSILLSLAQALLGLFSTSLFSSDDECNDDEDDDRETWENDPEAYYQWEMQRSLEEDVGCAAQNLFLALVESSSPTASPCHVRHDSFTITHVGGQGGSQHSVGSLAETDSGDGLDGRGKEIILPWLIQFLTNVKSQRLAVELEAGLNLDNITAVTDILAMMPLGNIHSMQIISNSAPSQLSSRQQQQVKYSLILQWDAIYIAAGLMGSMLENFPGFEFGAWFEACLGPSLGLLLRCNSTQKTQLPILRRRIIWLISCNSHKISFSSSHNPIGMLTSVLSQSSNLQNDLCVRLTAIQALETLLPQCAEQAPQLVYSIVEPAIPALYQLTTECFDVESRSSCLELISNLLVYAGISGLSFTNDILNITVSPLVNIWDQSTGQNLLLKRNVLTILSCIASIVGSTQAAVMYPMVLPMIDDSLSKDENVFLVEDALKIWWIFLRLSEKYDPLIGKLFIRADNLSRDLEHVMVLMRITECYVLLGGAEFLNDHAITLQTVLCNLVGEVRPRGAAYVFLVIEALLRSYPVEGGSLLLRCGVLKKILEACASNYWEDDKCEPDRVIVLYLTALSRILLSTPGMLQGLLPLTLIAGDVFREDELIALYIRKFQVAGNGAHGLLFQKLWAMLLISFYPPCKVTSYCNAVLGKSDEIFNILAYVLRNVNDSSSNILPYEVGYDNDEETVETGAETYEALLQQHAMKDVAHTQGFRENVSFKLNGLKSALGQTSHAQFLSTIEHKTLLQLEEILSTRK